MSEAGNTAETEVRGEFVIRVNARIPIRSVELCIRDELLRHEFLVVEASGKATGKMAVVVANVQDHGIARIDSATVELLSRHRNKTKSKERIAKICLRLQRGEKATEETPPRDALADRVTKELVAAACERQQLQQAWESRGTRFKELDPMWDDMAASGTVSSESIEAWLHRIMGQLEAFSSCLAFTKRLQKRLVKQE